MRTERPHGRSKLAYGYMGPRVYRSVNRRNLRRSTVATAGLRLFLHRTRLLKEGASIRFHIHLGEADAMLLVFPCGMLRSLIILCQRTALAKSRGVSLNERRVGSTYSD